MRIMQGVVLCILSSTLFTFPHGDEKCDIAGRVNYKGVADYPAVVYIEELEGVGGAVKTAASSAGESTLELSDDGFSQPVIAITAGSGVRFVNKGQSAHELYFSGNQAKKVKVEPSDSYIRKFDQPGVVSVKCLLHKKEDAHIFCGKLPYMAVTDKDGRFNIRNVPYGECTVKIWSAGLKPSQLSKTYKVTAAKGGVTDMEIVPPSEQAGGSITGTVIYKYTAKYPTVVYIEDINGTEFDPPAEKARMDQREKLFIPRVLPVVVGTTVEFLNSDPFEHNVFSPDEEGYDLGNWGKGEKREYTFRRTGFYTQLCSLHPEMIAYVIVVKTPYFAVADSSGKFEITGVPPGKWKLKVWNERMKRKQLAKTFDVEVKAAGKTVVELKP